MDNAESMKAKLQRQGFALSKTSGRSMRPLIWGGEHCVAVAPLDGEPMVGDLLMFRIRQSNGAEKSIVHRLVEIREDDALTSFEPQSSQLTRSRHAATLQCEPQSPQRRKLYITRGDNCIATETVRLDEIIGRVMEVHRISGWRPWHIIPHKKFAVTDGSYRLYSRLWRAIWPLRRFLYRVRAKLGIRKHSPLSLFKPSTSERCHND